MTGIELIAAERERQISVEGWTAEHDDKHNNRQLVRAAACYADPTYETVEFEMRDTPYRWPWEPSWWKPDRDPIRNLVKAGALIAAEIDRMQRASTAEYLAERKAQ